MNLQHMNLLAAAGWAKLFCRALTGRSLHVCHLFSYSQLKQFPVEISMFESGLRLRLGCADHERLPPSFIKPCCLPRHLIERRLHEGNGNIFIRPLKKF